MALVNIKLSKYWRPLRAWNRKNNDILPDPFNKDPLLGPYIEGPLSGHSLRRSSYFLKTALLSIFLSPGWVVLHYFLFLLWGEAKLLLLLIENLFLGQSYPFYDLQRIIWLKVSSKVAQGIYELTRGWLVEFPQAFRHSWKIFLSVSICLDLPLVKRIFSSLFIMICFCVKSLTVKVQNCSSILLRPFLRPNASAHQKIITSWAVSREYFYKFSLPKLETSFLFCYGLRDSLTFIRHPFECLLGHCRRQSCRRWKLDRNGRREEKEEGESERKGSLKDEGFLGFTKQAWRGWCCRTQSQFSVTVKCVRANFLYAGTG